MKTRWGILFWVSAFLIGINGCDDSGAADSPDLCPDDPNKTGPGVCGCSVADDDLNNNTIPDCFDQEMDLCPEDPAKTLPGVCGCGIADEDTDGDTLPDCLAEQFDLCPEDPAKTLPGVCGCGVADEDTDGDTLPDCLDACPEDPNKTSQGFCGCGVVDSAENIVDSDGDGVINCLDYCPNEKTKHEKPAGDIEVAAYCALPDTDGDGYDDPDDACPTDPSIHEWPEDGSLPDCGNYSEESNVFTITNAKDLDDLRERLLKAYEPNSCKTGSMMCDGNNLRRCHAYSMYRTLQCTSCTTDGETGKVTYDCGESADFLPFDDFFLKIEMANDIDLRDWLKTEILPNGMCVPSEFDSLVSLINVHWDGKGHTIRYTHNGVRCTLPKPLMSSIVSSTFENTNIDLDVEGEAAGIVFTSVDASILKNMTVSGSLTSFNVVEVGGVAGILLNTMPEPTQVIDVAVKDISVVNNTIDTSIGGMFGHLKNTRKTPIMIDLSNVEQKVLSVKGRSSVAGLFGMIELTSDDNTAPSFKIANIKGQVDKVHGEKDGVGGMIGVVPSGVHIENIDWTSGEVEGGGFAIGGLIGFTGGVLSDINVKVNSIKCAGSACGGLIGRNESNGSIQNVDLRVRRIEGGDNMGGLIGFDGGTVSHASLAFDTVVGARQVGGAFGLVKTKNPASYISVRGNSIVGDDVVGGVVGEAHYRSWSDVISYVNHVEATNVNLSNGGSFLGGFAGYIEYQNTESSLKILDGANIRTDKMVGQEMIGGLAGGIKYDGDNLDALALSNISSQTNFVFHRNIFPYHGGFVGGILTSSTAKAITFENVVSTASKYYVDDEEPNYYGMLIGLSPTLSWNLKDTFFYTSGRSYETTIKSGFVYSTTGLRYAETASDGVISTDQIVEKLGKGWAVDDYVLDGKSVKIPVRQIEGMPQPGPFE